MLAARGRAPGVAGCRARSTAPTRTAPCSAPRRRRHLGARRQASTGEPYKFKPVAAEELLPGAQRRHDRADHRRRARAGRRCSGHEAPRRCSSLLVARWRTAARLRPLARAPGRRPGLVHLAGCDLAQHADGRARRRSDRAPRPDRRRRHRSREPATPGEVERAASSSRCFCPRGGVSRVRLDLGEREDTRHRGLARVPATMLGGPGADQLSGGPGRRRGRRRRRQRRARRRRRRRRDRRRPWRRHARRRRRRRPDSLSRDGLADTIACGAGADAVDADTLDQVAADCESRRAASRPRRPPATSPTSPARRWSRPAPTVQRSGRSRRVRVYATSSEPGTVSASGFLDIAGLRLPADAPSRAQSPVGGAGAAITYKLSRRPLRARAPGALRGRAQGPGRARRRRAPIPAARSSEAPACPRFGWLRGGADREAGAGDRRTERDIPSPATSTATRCATLSTTARTTRTGARSTPTRPSARNPGRPRCRPATPTATPATPTTTPTAIRSTPRADNCRVDRNPGQEDADGDGFGDLCPPVDADADGVINDDDNCDFAANPDQQDLDGDDKGDVCDRDLDGDRFDDEFDNCPTVYNLEAHRHRRRRTDQRPARCATATASAPRAIPTRRRSPRQRGGDRHRAEGDRASAAHDRRSRQLAAGMIVRMRCSEACAATARVAVGRRLARKLGLGRDVSSPPARPDSTGRAAPTPSFVPTAAPAGPWSAPAQSPPSSRPRSPTARATRCGYRDRSPLVPDEPGTCR